MPFANNIGLGASILGFGSSLLGSGFQNDAANAALFQAREDARELERIGREEASRVIRQAARFIGDQKVAFVGSGVDISEGTPMEIVGETVANAALAAERVREGREQQADRLRRIGIAAQATGSANATATLLGGGIQLASGVGRFVENL